MQINLSPELKKRVEEWGREFNRPSEELAIELLEEFFEDSDTGAEIAAAVANGQAAVCSWSEVKNRLHALAD